MIKPVACKKVSHAQRSSILSNLTEFTYHVSGPKLKIASLLCNNDVRTDTPALPDNSIIVQGMNEKNCILSAYQDKFGAGHPDSIITGKKGKTANDILLTCTRMRPSLDKLYQVSNFYMHNDITTVIKEYRVTFSAEDLSNIQLISKDFANMVPKVLCWIKIDFTTMHKPLLGYKEQNHIDPHHVEMASTAMVHFGLDPGKFIWFLAGKHTGNHQDLRCSFNGVQDYVTPDN